MQRESIKLSVAVSALVGIRLVREALVTFLDLEEWDRRQTKL